MKIKNFEKLRKELEKAESPLLKNFLFEKDRILATNKRVFLIIRTKNKDEGFFRYENDKFVKAEEKSSDFPSIPERGSDCKNIGEVHFSEREVFAFSIPNIKKIWVERDNIYTYLKGGVVFHKRHNFKIGKSFAIDYELFLWIKALGLFNTEFKVFLGEDNIFFETADGIVLIAKIVYEKVEYISPILNSIKKLIKRVVFKRRLKIDLSQLLNPELIESAEENGVEKLEIKDGKVRIADKITFGTSIKKNFLIYTSALRFLYEIKAENFLTVTNVIITDNIVVLIKPIFKKVSGGLGIVIKNKVVILS